MDEAAGAEPGWAAPSPVEPVAGAEAEEDPPRSAHARLEAPEVVRGGQRCTVIVGLAREPVLGVAGAEAEEDPPRSAHARLEAPEVVRGGQRCTVIAGLAREPVLGVAGAPLVRPASSHGAYDLEIQLVADGFDLADEDARRVLRVTAADPYPSYAAELTAQEVGADVAARAIQAIYAVDGQTIGFAVRPIVVLGPGGTAPTVTPTVDPGVVGVPTREPAADLTIHVVRGADAPGRLLWTMVPGDRRVPVPAQAVVSDIGTEPQAFAKKLIQGVARYDGQGSAYPFLRGAGLSIAEHVPVEVTDALAAAARLVGPSRPLTVFLVSEEPYVPWELAVVEPPLLPDAPPFLAAQVALGRWVLGQRRPTLPPPVRVEVRDMAVIGGVYDGAAARLLEAEAEVEALTERYGAVAVQARADDILLCLGGVPEAQALHFAVHGTYDAAGIKEGLVLLDGSLLDPLQVKGCLVHGTPFVFLNACQVGSGNELLGDYAGVAQSFLYAGAASVVAPLWNVRDEVARELALRFYEATLEGGRPPAEVLRELRGRFDDEGPDAIAATFLAYQFFGHPALTLTRDPA